MLDVLIAAGASGLAWFVLAGALYENPITKKILAPEAEHPGVRRWSAMRQMLILQLLFGVGLPSVAFAAVFWGFRSALPAEPWAAAGAFTLVLVALRLIPRGADMALLSTYPTRHLLVDGVNGAITSFAVAATLAFTLPLA